jgi:hypothetical protein
MPAVRVPSRIAINVIGGLVVRGRPGGRVHIRVRVSS